MLTTETIALPIALIVPIDLESGSEPKNYKVKSSLSHLEKLEQMGPHGTLFWVNVSQCRLRQVI